MLLQRRLFLIKFLRTSLWNRVDYCGLKLGRAIVYGLNLLWGVSFEFWLAPKLPSCLNFLESAVQLGLLFVYSIVETCQTGRYFDVSVVVNEAQSFHLYRWPIGLWFRFEGFRLSGRYPERIMIVDDFSLHLFESLGGVTLNFQYLSLFRHKGHTSFVDGFPVTIAYVDISRLDVA